MRRSRRQALRGNDVVRVGDTLLRVEHHGLGPGGAAPADAEPTIAFMRPPSVQPVFEPVELEAPSAPGPVKPQHFPILMLVLPLLMGAVLFLATRQWQTILFIALSPLLAIGTYLDAKRSAKGGGTGARQLRRGPGGLWKEPSARYGSTPRSG